MIKMISSVEPSKKLQKIVHQNLPYILISPAPD